MRTNPDREKLFEETLLRLSETPPAEGLDVLLHYFLGVLKGMDVQTARRIREELSDRFGGRYCSSQICRRMAELVNGHLAPHPARANS